MFSLLCDSIQDFKCLDTIFTIVKYILQPEIEMVASGLRKNLKLEQREHLLNLLEEVSNSEGRRIAAAALGLQVLRKH